MNKITAPQGLDPAASFVEDAERKKPDDDDTGDAGHNSSSKRLEAQATAIEKWCELQEQEDALIKLHIDPIREEKQKVKSDLKSEFEVPTEAFNARAALRKIERRHDKDEVVLATHELFEALPVGHNLDLIAVGERVAKKKADEKTAAETKAKEKAERKSRIKAAPEKAL